MENQQTQEISVFDYLKFITRWGDVRWNAKSVLKILKRQGVFVLESPAVQQWYNENPGLENGRVRGYLGLDATYKLKLILLSEDADIGFWLDPLLTEDLHILDGPYQELDQDEFDEIYNAVKEDEPEMAKRIKRWMQAFEVYVNLMANQEKRDTMGLVRLFDIPGGDLKQELEDESTHIYCFFSLYSDASIELIFQGMKKDNTGQWISIKNESALGVAADDFTTPRPPFDSEQGYGMLQ